MSHCDVRIKYINSVACLSDFRHYNLTLIRYVIFNSYLCSVYSLEKNRDDSKAFLIELYRKLYELINLKNWENE